MFMEKLRGYIVWSSTGSSIGFVIYAAMMFLTSCGVSNLTSSYVDNYQQGEIGDGFGSVWFREFNLKDGTHCISIDESVTCDWE